MELLRRTLQFNQVWLTKAWFTCTHPRTHMLAHAPTNTHTHTNTHAHTSTWPVALGASLSMPMQSCYRAWEYLGFIAEKEQLFREAAERYEKAWHFSHQRNPGIGGLP